MTTELAPRLVRKFAWEEGELVEGTEALLWRADDLSAADVEELPDPSTAVPAVLSWVRAKIIRFETATPEPLPELLLVSTLAVGGPAQFVLRKQYQVGTTAVCDPPRDIRIVERRDLFRIPVATLVKVGSTAGEWTLHSLDCSLGGLRICPPQPLDVGTELDVKVELAAHTEVTVRAIVRHCHPYGRGAHENRASLDRDDNLSMVGLQFLGLPSDVERHLTQFVGYHQRRLMPRVQAVTPIEYRSHGRPQFLEAFAVEVSPGDVVFLAYEAHQPGDCLELKLRIGRQDYKFNACTLSCDLTTGDEGVARRHIIRASLEDGGDAAEAQFRKAVRELAIEKVSAKRQR
jgi:c-di-GMP-binding flagellar brake protein YcgR